MNNKTATHIGNGTFTFVKPNIFAGNDNGFDIVIDADSGSYAFSITFGVKNDNNDNPKKGIESLLDKRTIVTFNRNQLRITSSMPSFNKMYTKINSILEKVIPYLKDNKYHNVCFKCGEKKQLFLVRINKKHSYMCDYCFSKESVELNSKKELENHKQKNVFLGIIGAIIGCIPGFALWAILSIMRIQPMFAGALITLGAVYGYTKLGNTIKIPGLVISIIIAGFMLFMAQELAYSVLIYNDNKYDFIINIWDTFKALPYYFNITSNNYFHNFITELLFGGLFFFCGIIGSITFYKDKKNAFVAKKVL